MTQDRTDHLLARSIVLEMLVASLIIELARHATRDVESVRRIMLPVERELTALTKDAADGKQQIAEEARSFFNELSMSILASLPNNGKH